MDELWTNRKRHTNALVGTICRHLLQSQEELSPEQMHGLAALCWITKNHDSVSNSYVKTVKIPALRAIFPELKLPTEIEAAESTILRATDLPLRAGDIVAHTGFTNLRGGYRYSSLTWFKQNHQDIGKLFKIACLMSSDAERVRLAKLISDIPKVPGAGKLAQHPMRPECILSPLFFAIDSQLRFPIINGNDNIGRVFSEFDLKRGELDQQCRSMLTIIDDCNLKDAAQLDEWSFQELKELKLRKTSVEIKNERLADKAHDDNQLQQKDAEDVEALQQELTITQTRKHNKITNLFIKELQGIELLEGSARACRYDILIPKYASERDLMIEVKSITSIQSVRMAIGQLFSYTFAKGKASTTDLAICLSEKPSADICSLLEWLDISLIWEENSKLHTNSVKLSHLFSFTS